jgi:polysaccharide pyruvyl transferase WcaK-like protein
MHSLGTRPDSVSSASDYQLHTHRNMSRVCITGFYGHRNTGDNALAACVAAGIADARTQSRIVMLCPPLVMPRNAHVSFSRRFVDRFVWGPDAAIKREAACGIHVLGGGSVIHDCFGIDGLRQDVTKYRRLKAAGHKMCAVSVGIGPFVSDEGRAVAADILSLMDVVCVRDAISKHEAEALGCFSAIETFDTAVLLPTIGLTEPRHDPIACVARTRPIIAISLCGVRRDRNTWFAVESQVIPKVLHAVRRAHQSKDCHFWFLEFNGHLRFGDKSLAMQCVRELEGSYSCEVVPYHENPLVTFRRIQRCSGVVAMRLHAAIFAFTARIPFVMLSYHDKCLGFAGAARVPAECVHEISEFDPEALASHIDSMATGKWKNASHLWPDSVADAQDRARQNYSWFRTI